MFIKRLITSLILIPIILGLIFFANPWILVLVLAGITLIAAIECLHLIPIHNLLIKIIFFLILGLSVWASYYEFPYWMSLGLLLWVLICIAVLSFPLSQKYWGHSLLVASIFIVLLPLFIHSLVHIYNVPQGKAYISYLLFLIWAADIGAYAAGKLWGKHKMIPQVSPGKSWEGVVGGLVLSLLIITQGYLYFKPWHAIIWFLVSLGTVLISIFGDLFISVLKRRCCLKDTGHIISGHGGILDRLDSLIAAAPVFYLGLQCF